MTSACYQVALLEDKKLAVGTVALRISALRFFYLKVLKKYALRYELPYPKNPKWARRLPTLPSPMMPIVLPNTSLPI